MASDYGLAFGFRRSDESMATREGRLKTPKTGTPLNMGSCVAFDPANPGYLKAGAADEPAVPGWSGLLVQEEQWDSSIYGVDASLKDSYQLGVALPNRLAVIWSGAGTKVWFKNTAAVVRADGRSIPVRGLVEFTGGLAIGDYLAWNGTLWAKTAVAAAQFLRITTTDGTSYAEAVLLK